MAKKARNHKYYGGFLRAISEGLKEKFEKFLKKLIIKYNKQNQLLGSCYQKYKMRLTKDFNLFVSNMRKKHVMMEWDV